VTQVSGGGTQECVVTLFDVKAGGGSITATRQGKRSPVQLPEYDFAEQHARRHRFLHLVALVAESVAIFRVALGAVVRLARGPHGYAATS
jgi:hypothetical protein